MSIDRFFLCPRCATLLSTKIPATMTKCMNCQNKFYVNEEYEITEPPADFEKGLVQESIVITDPDVIAKWHQAQEEGLNREDVEAQIENLVAEKEIEKKEIAGEESQLRVKDRQAAQVVVFDKREEKKQSFGEKHARKIRFLIQLIILCGIGYGVYWMLKTPEGQEVYAQAKVKAEEIFEQGKAFFQDHLKQEPKVKEGERPGGTLLD